MLGLIVSTVTGIVKSLVSGFVDNVKAKQAMKLAELQNKARLLADRESNNHAWEMASLTDKDKWLRRGSFLMFSAPFIVALFSPDYVKHYFETALAVVPVFWQKGFMYMNAGIWGLSAFKQLSVGLVNEMKKPKGN